jgi:signal transduction histidine kinase
MLDTLADVEQRIRTEQRSRGALQERLRESERLASIGRLAAGLAHELGTPLSVVDGHAQRALRRPTLEPRVRTSLGTIRKEVDRMAKLVRQLLDYGKTERRARARVKADQLATTAVEALELEAQRREISVTVDADPRADLDVAVDETRVGQALVNLVKNGIQAASDAVVVSVSGDEGTICFEVTDDGPGVDEGAREHLFEPFFTTKGATGGVGLGLAIVEAVAREHGGHVRALSSTSGGARFRLTLSRDSEAIEGAS